VNQVLQINALANLSEVWKRVPLTRRANFLALARFMCLGRIAPKRGDMPQFPMPFRGEVGWGRGGDGVGKGGGDGVEWRGGTFIEGY